MRLFIIGNGFDIDHNLETDFHFFKTFLECTYLPSFNRHSPVFPNVGIGRDGEMVINQNCAAQIFYHLIEGVCSDSQWKGFEERLGKFDYHYLLDLIEKDDDNPFHYYNNLENLANDLEISLLYCVSDLFCEWVEQVDQTIAKKKYFFHPSDLFLTFNYTNILEDLYGINSDNICHIHGSLNDGICVIGHNNVDRQFDDYDDIVSFSIEKIHNLLIKNTSELYGKNIAFFERVYQSKIEKIVLFGFSLSDVDSIYLIQLFKHLDTSNICLFLSPYEDKNEKELKICKLKELGFKGYYGGSFS